jgi:hypothetical protein
MTKCFEMGTCDDGVALARVSLGFGQVLLAYTRDKQGNHGIIFREITEPVEPGTMVRGDDPRMGGRALFVLCNSLASAEALQRSVTKLCEQLAAAENPEKKGNE